jgi:hypothetical protein
MANDQGNCRDEYTQFEQCKTDNNGNMSNCKFYYDVMSQCKQVHPCSTLVKILVTLM